MGTTLAGYGLSILRATLLALIQLMLMSGESMFTSRFLVDFLVQTFRLLPESSSTTINERASRQQFT
ncbi:MAG: hypothetical protein ACP5PQ_06795 [Thermoproteota archaeon]